MPNNRYEAVQPLFAAKTRELDIKAGLFDLDNTLLDTSPLYESTIAEFCAFLYPLLAHVGIEVSWEEFLKIFNLLYQEAYRELGADPALWQHTITLLSEYFGSSEQMNPFSLALNQGLTHFNKIYTTSPAILDGAAETLETISQSGLRTAAVTLADQEWTDIKTESMRTIHQFDYVRAVSPRRQNGVKAQKTGKDWVAAAEQLKLQPDQAFVIGDSLSSDITPAYEGGFRHLVYLLNESFINPKGQVPDGTLIVEGGIAQFIPTFLAWEAGRARTHYSFGADEAGATGK